MFLSSLRRLLRLACIVSTLGLAAAYSSVSLADGCPASCSGNRFNIDVSVDSSIISNGSTVHYSVTAFNNLAPFLDGCDAGVSSCNPAFGNGVAVQFCCPSPTGDAYPLFDFAPGHCTQLSLPGGDSFPAATPGTLKAYPPVACVVTVNPGVGQATGLAGAGDATNPNNPNPNLGTIHFPAGDRGVQASKPIPVVVVACGDGAINQACEKCDTNAFPANAPPTHGACRTGGTCGVEGCTFCGDGVVNGPPGAEACDDGNDIDNDGCRNSCELPDCGDGVINQSCETCDTSAFPANAPATHGECRTGACGNPGCTFCGDGAVNGGEACDDGNAVDTDGCRNDCTLPVCGDGLINETCETCDGTAFPANAPATHGACRTGTCGKPGCTFCGDGAVNGGEACDDGNAVDTDGCRNDCTLPVCGDGLINETCETCDGAAFPANAPASHGACRTGACGDPGCTFCGDGVVNGGEQCDDGNAIDTDGCRNNCNLPTCGDGIIDKNASCTETCDTNAFPANAPSSHGACRTGTCGNPGCTFCGDHIVNGSEQCDDGNNIDTDSCRNNCTTPPPQIAIKKYTNGQDANDPDAPGVPECIPDGAVTWRYDVTNPGQIPIPRAQITVTDNQPGVNPQPVLVGAFVQGDANTNNLLDPGETWVYQATGPCLNLLLPPPQGVIVVPNVCRQGDAQRPGRTAYTNIGTVTIPGLSASDPSSYCNPPAQIAIRKFTNGQDANDPNAAGVPECAPGSIVTWRYDVTNPGTVPVPRANISVTDNQPGVNPQPVLAGAFVQGDANTNNLLEPGETWIYQATGPCLNLLLPPPQGVIVAPNVCRQGDAQRPGRTAYTNIGTVTIPGATASDPSSYCNPPAQIAIRKFTNGQDANDPNAGGVPECVPGGAVTWRYDVTNPGSVPVPRAQITVTDNQPGVNPQPVLVGAFVQGDVNTNDLLEPGETWIYQANGTCLNLLLPPPGGVIVTPNVCRQGDAQRPGRTAYTNIGTATIPGASASDPSSYCNPPAQVAIRKFTNGQDANDPNAGGVPECATGSTVTWRYEVTNPGTVPVPRDQITVTDNQQGVTPQPVLNGAFVQGDVNTNNLLDHGETWIYQATGTCVNLVLPPPGVIVVPNVCRQGDAQRPGKTAYVNIGTVTIPGASATDPSSYCNPPAQIAIKKYTNGADANDPNAAGVPEIPPNGVVTWRYDVTNPGTVPVPRAQISVTDNQPGVTPQPVLVGAFVSGDTNTNDLLEPGETWLYQATGIALDLLLPPPPGVIVQSDVCRQGNAQNPGHTAYTNIGTVTIPGASASDPSSYCNPPCTTCAPVGECTVPYPFSSGNPLTSVVFNESEVLRSFTATVGSSCMPNQIRLYYNDEHALTLGVRRVIVKTSSGTTTTDYPVSPLLTNPGSAIDPQIGTNAISGDQAGTDLSGRPLYPALFITDTTADPSSLSGDWQYGGTPIPPHAVFGTWKAAVRTVDKTKSPVLVTVTPDADPSQNHWNLDGGDPAPPGLVDQGYGAEVRWDASRLNLIPGHTYRFYFMVHDGDQNKSGGDTGHGCANVQTAPVCRPACETDADCNDNDVCTSDHCVNNACVHDVPPGSSCQCSTSCPDVVHPGVITTTIDANGDVTAVFNQSTDINDNSYGTNVVDWPGSHSFGNLTGSDKAQFVFRDANGNVVFDFNLDYISAKTGTPSGYASLGATGGDGSVNSGQATWLLDWQTSEAANLNNTGYCVAGNCTVSGVNLLVNSPPTNPAHTSYNVPPAFSQWNFNITYTVKISHLAFGAAGFGSVTVPFVHNSPPKCGNNATAYGSCPCSGTIGDFVWNDSSLDGVQDPGEAGLPGVGLILKSGGGAVGSATTDANGRYEFTGRCAGAYTVEVNASTLPAGFVASPCNAGLDDARDNDCSPAAVTLPNDQASDSTIDFGYHGQPCQTGANCTDNNVCNGVETCVGGTCRPGVPLDCDDNVPCTTDSCDPIAGCSNTAAGTHASIASDFNDKTIAAGRTIWFNANFKASGVGTQKTTVRWANSTVTLKVGTQVLTLPVPDGVVVFDPAVSCATTSFVNGKWQTTVPTSGSDEIFLSGLSYLVPSDLPGKIKPVTWQGDFFVDKSGVSLTWKWGAAVYANTNMSDYNTIGVKPTHANACLYNNGDHAGTPENKKAFVVAGARGGGGSNYTGSWSGSQSVQSICATPAQPVAADRVANLVLTDRQTLTWSTALNATYYDIVRGTIEDLRAAPGTGTSFCDFDDLASTQLWEIDAPAPGQCFFYVVRGDAVAPAAGTYNGPGEAGRDTLLETPGGENCTHRLP